MTVGIIGGSGLADIEGLSFCDEHKVSTPFGDISAPIKQANHNDREVMFLARHGAASSSTACYKLSSQHVGA